MKLIDWRVVWFDWSLESTSDLKTEENRQISWVWKSVKGSGWKRTASWATSIVISSSSSSTSSYTLQLGTSVNSEKASFRRRGKEEGTYLWDEHIRSQFCTIYSRVQREKLGWKWRIDRRSERGEGEKSKNNRNVNTRRKRERERVERWLTNHEPYFWQVFTSSLTVSVHHFFQSSSLFNFDDQLWETTTLDLIEYGIHTRMSNHAFKRERERDVYFEGDMRVRSSFRFDFGLF